MFRYLQRRARTLIPVAIVTAVFGYMFAGSTASADDPVHYTNPQGSAVLSCGISTVHVTVSNEPTADNPTGLDDVEFVIKFVPDTGDAGTLDITTLPGKTGDSTFTKDYVIGADFPSDNGTIVIEAGGTQIARSDDTSTCSGDVGTPPVDDPTPPPVLATGNPEPPAHAAVPDTGK